MHSTVSVGTPSMRGGRRSQTLEATALLSLVGTRYWTRAEHIVKDLLRLTYEEVEVGASHRWVRHAR